MQETENVNTTPETSTAAAAEPAKKGSKKLLIIILAVVLLGGAGGGFYYWRTTAAKAGVDEEAETSKSEKKSKKSKSKKESDEEFPDDEEDSPKSETAASVANALTDDEDVASVIELQPFIVNLADDDQARYLRITISVGVGGEGGEGEKADPIFITRVRNAILAVLSVKKSEDVLSVKGKGKLRRELLKAARIASESPKVEAIYITDLIVQL